MQTSFAQKIKAEGSVTFQNIFSPMADFRAVVSVLPCSPTNKGKKNLCGCAEKANRQWAFVAFWLSSHVNIKTAAAFADWLAPKKGALFSLIYFFGSFCIYYIPHNYVIPQAMPHAIPQTHSAFYPHRVKFCLFACSFLLIVLHGVLGAKRDTSEILQKSERSVSSYQVCNYRTSKTRD